MGRPTIISKFNASISVNRDGPKNMVHGHHPGKVSLGWKGSVPTQRGDRRKNKRLNDRGKD